MKKILLSVVCLVVVGMQSVYAQIAVATLHHIGQVTTFSSSRLSDALESAVDGDTIYLSNGVFSSDILIDKRITLIGVGMETIVSGSIVIAIPDTARLSSQVLQNVYVQNNIYIDKPVTGLIISQTRFFEFFFRAITDSSLIDRCVCAGTMHLSSDIKDLQVVGSKIQQVCNDCSEASAATFYNCNIRKLFNHSTWGNDIYRGTCRATYINCIIWMLEYFTFSGVSVNCLIGPSSDTNNYYDQGTSINSWGIESITFDDEMNVIEPDDSVLAEYKGTDGKPIGCMGGSVPFSLVPPTPKVTDHKIEVDNKERKINVTLIIGNNKMQ